MNGRNQALVLAIGAALVSGHASGQQRQNAGQDMMAGMDKMMAGMDKMNHDMANAPMTGDADHDFVVMMMPHHQGAIDMAQVELRDGKDPALRRLAAEIIAAQQKEIALMKRWQAGRSGR